MDKIIVVTRCPVCTETHELSVDFGEYENYRDGMLIQKAMPSLSDEEREMLITGTCGRCWDEMFNNEE